jgi:DNA invertase Pin-like site-specific DNA recombinase
MGVEISPELVFPDDGVTGTSLKKRTGLENLLEAVRSGKFKKANARYVFCWSTDRWARNAADALTTERVLAEHGIILISVSEGYDLTTLDGRMEFGICAQTAEMQNRLRTADLWRGIIRELRNGGLIGHAPYGYRRLKNEHGKNRLIPDPKTAPITIEIIRRIIQGESPTDIASDLNKRGIEFVGRAHGEADDTEFLDCPQNTFKAYKNALEAAQADFLINASEQEDFSKFLGFCEHKVVIDGVGVRFRNLPHTQAAPRPSGASLQSQKSQPSADYSDWEKNVLKGSWQ